jgi:hypothetical protein
MKRTVAAAFVLALWAAHGFPQLQNTPASVAIAFYTALRERRYVEGFAMSVYRDAIRGLTAEQLRELEPDFARTFSEIPERINVRGQQITGDIATLFVTFDDAQTVENVYLIRVNGEWLVGDKESLDEVRTQGKAFFFNARMASNETEAFDVMSRIVGAEFVFQTRFQGRCGTLDELIHHGALSRDLSGGVLNGYRFTLTLGADQKSFDATATPVVYGKTGRLSFYADGDGVRAEDKKGKPATRKSPMYQPA